jgi:thiamine biosynthesis protein ThiS
VFARFVKVIVNGETVDVGETKTIADLVARYELSPQSILVEHNGTALHRREWLQTTLKASDQIEFIRVVAGG